MNRQKLMGFALLIAMASLAGSLSAGPVAEVQNFGDTLVFSPVVTDYEHIILTVTGPCNYVTRDVVEEGDLAFRLSSETIDGNYTAELVVIPRVDPGIISILKEARQAGDETVAKQLCRDGKLPGDPETQSDGFRVFKGQIIYDLETVEKSAITKSADFTEALLSEALFTSAPAGDETSGVPTKDFVINDDLIVDGSACIGFDCVNGESFGFDTIRLKENNLRIKFDDTSVAASFPRNDWQLTANDSANGGASKFSIDDISGSRTPFTVEANARSHSLYVDDGGRIGSRTSTPSTEIHTIDGDTPTLRLQQDGSSGFAPQTWDVAGNETNFFIRDVTNGSTLPFRIRPSAPTSSIFVDVDGDVGMGTSSPDADLHILDTAGGDHADLQFEAGGQAWKWRGNATNGNMNLIDDTASETPFKVVPGAPTNSLVIAATGVGINTNSPNAAAALDVDGAIYQRNAVLHADYVFEPGYELESIEEHAEFMWRERHLPAVPKRQVDEQGREVLEIGAHRRGILEELEKAHIYIGTLNSHIQELQAELQSLRDIVETQSSEGSID